MLRALSCPDARCREVARRNARRLRAPGEMEIARYDSGTSHALGEAVAATRIAWTVPGRPPTVQCVLVARSGGPLTGTSVTLLRLSAPVGPQESCD